MKKLILTMILALMVFAVSKANNAERISPEWPKITITIEIGQLITCIPYWSICRLDVGVGLLAATAEAFPSGSGSGGGGGGSWILSLPREKFAIYYPAFLAKLDGKSTVTFEGSYTLPVEVQKALGAQKTLVIKANETYPLKFENGEYVITFPL
jgi:hypothetical protein